MNGYPATYQGFLLVLKSIVSDCLDKSESCSASTSGEGVMTAAALKNSLEILSKRDDALDQMAALLQPKAWNAFYTHILNDIKPSIDIWGMPDFDVQLVYLFCRLAEKMYERTENVEYAYICARGLFEQAYDEAYQQSLMDGIYDSVYRMADKAAAMLIAAWEKTPSEEAYSYVLWALEHKRKCHGIEYSDSVFPKWSEPSWVDAEIIKFIRSAPKEYRALPESIRLLEIAQSGIT